MSTLNNKLTIISNAMSLYGVSLGNNSLNSLLLMVNDNTSLDDFLNNTFSTYLSNLDNSSVSTKLVANLGITDPALAQAAISYVTSVLDSTDQSLHGSAINNILTAWSGLENDPDYGSYVSTWKEKYNNSVLYAEQSNTSDVSIDQLSSQFLNTNIATAPLSDVVTTIVSQIGALYDKVVHASDVDSLQTLYLSSTDGFFNSLYATHFGDTDTSVIADQLVSNLGLTGMLATLESSYIANELSAVDFTHRGDVITKAIDRFSGLTNDTTFGQLSTAWNAKVSQAVQFINDGYTDNVSFNGLQDFYNQIQANKTVPVDHLFNSTGSFQFTDSVSASMTNAGVLPSIAGFNSAIDTITLANATIDPMKYINISNASLTGTMTDPATAQQVSYASVNDLLADLNNTSPVAASSHFVVEAALVNVTGGNFAGDYLFINDSNAFADQNDMLISLTGVSSAITDSNFVFA